MNKFDLVRSLYVGSNRKSINERLKLNVPMEQWIIDTVNHHGISHKGKLLNNWEKASEKIDKTCKIDAVHKINDKENLYIQVKFRQPDSGNDIEVAVIQPYNGLKEFKNVIGVDPTTLQKEVWARDFRFYGQFYACLNNSWNLLRIVNYNAIKSKVMTLLGEWVDSGNELKPYYGKNTFISKKYGGMMLKCKKDSGYNSYDSGILKILCYIPEEVFTKKEMVCVEMIQPPEYLIKN